MAKYGPRNCFDMALPTPCVWLCWKDSKNWTFKETEFNWCPMLELKLTLGWPVTNIATYILFEVIFTLPNFCDVEFLWVIYKFASSKYWFNFE